MQRRGLISTASRGRCDWDNKQRQPIISAFASKKVSIEDLIKFVGSKRNGESGVQEEAKGER